MKPLYFGTILVAFVVGLVTGLSASPVVGVLIPFLFSALTAGGAIYTFTANESVAKLRKQFLGWHLILFSFGFGVGLWLGVAAKFHPSILWPIKTQKPVYQSFEYGDALFVAAAIELDRRMMASGANEIERQKILSKLIQNVNQRKQADGTLSDEDRNAFKNFISQDSKQESDLRFFPIADVPGLPVGIKSPS